MGTCVCHKKHDNFSMIDLNGMDKYYALMSKRKVDILMWLIDSKGPWETPESFLCFKRSDTKTNPIKISNEDEIRIRRSQSQSHSITNNDLKQIVNLHVDHKEMSTKSKHLNIILPIVTSTDIKEKKLLDCSSNW